jgi:hypothetical protein
MKAKVVIALALGLATVAGPGVAFAAWGSPGSGFATGRALTMPTVDPPAGTVTGRNVVLTWPQASFPDSTEVDGYVVERYDASDTPQGVGAACSGTIAALTCTEEAVPPGTWTYRVTPRHHGWIGLPSAASVSVTVGSPSLTLTPPTTFGTLPGTLVGSLENFVTGETVTFRLDDPVSGTALDASVASSPIPFSGSSSVDVTIPALTTAGSHTVYAIGSMGSEASAAFSVSPHDVSAPVVSTAVVAKSAGGIAGFVKPGGQYRVYASVTDVGSPETGVAAVRANVSTLTTGATSVALTAGSFTVDGVTYNYRSGVQTVSASTTPGTKSFSITATDVAANTGAQGGFSATVDGVAPSAADVQGVNGGPTPGRMETGDQLVLTYSEQMEPDEILAGWTGEATNVTVRLQNNGGGDRITIRRATGGGTLPLGTVFLNRTDYTTNNRNFTASTMVMSGATITITVGTPNGAVTTAAAAATMTWTPSNTATDLAGNACTTTTRSELGALDLDL